MTRLRLPRRRLAVLLAAWPLAAPAMDAASSAPALSALAWIAVGALAAVAATVALRRRRGNADADADARTSADAESLRLQTLLHTIPDLVWLKDPDGIYLACNRAFQTYFNAPEADILGRSDADFVGAEHAARVRDDDAAAVAAGTPTATERWSIIPALRYDRFDLKARSSSLYPLQPASLSDSALSPAPWLFLG